MAYFFYRLDFLRFGSVRMSLSRQELLRLHRHDAPASDTWTPRRVWECSEELAYGDFPSLAGCPEAPIMTARAWELLRPLIGGCCEALPLLHAGETRYVLVHVLNTRDVLADMPFGAGEGTGRFIHVNRADPRRDVPRGQPIFKLPLACGGELLVDDAVRDAIQRHRLKGLQLTELLSRPGEEEEAVRLYARGRMRREAQWAACLDGEGSQE